MLLAMQAGGMNVSREIRMDLYMGRKQSINLRLLTIVVVLTGILPLATALCQGRDQVRGDLERTDELIERATEVVKETGSVIGERYLERARELQARAWESYRGERYGMTRELTEAARDQALKAIGAVQVSDYNLSTVRREIDRTDELLRRVRDRTAASNNEQIVSLLENAVRIQIEAREFFRGNRFKIALKATLKARETASRASRMADNSLVVERELRRTEKLIEKATEAAEDLGSNGAVNDMLRNAQELQSAADQEFRSGNLRAAMSKTQRARDLTRQALQRIEKNLQPNRIGGFLDHTEELIREVEDILSQSPNGEAERLLEAAIDHQKKATEAYSEGNLQTAIVEARAARELVNKAIDLIEG